MPKLGDTSTTYPQSQWPYYVRQGTCDPGRCLKGLHQVDHPLGPPPVCSNGLMPNGPLHENPVQQFCAAVRHLLLAAIAKMVIRTGYGIFYTQDIGNAYFDMARNIAGRVTVHKQNSTPPYGNSNLTWANATPGAAGGSSLQSRRQHRRVCERRHP